VENIKYYLAIIGGIISLSVAGILYLPILGGVGGLATTTLLGAKSQIAPGFMLTTYDNYTINQSVGGSNLVGSAIVTAAAGNMNTLVLLFVVMGIIAIVGGILGVVTHTTKSTATIPNL
jgi:hypothetical protein